MYCPHHFEETRTTVLQQLVAQQPLGTLVTLQDGLPCADEIPFLLDASAGSHGTLHAHVARGNPLWQRHDPAQPVLVVFKGPQAYISPSWYPSKAEHGKVVPTWNYIVVQAGGPLRVIDGDDAWLRRQLDALTRQNEQRVAQNWQPGDAPAEYIAQMMRAIVGIEIPIARLAGKWKVSQNQSDANRQGVIAALQTHAPQMAQAVRSLTECA